MKLIYTPGLNPTPMLAIENTKNKEVFEGLKKESDFGEILNNQKYSENGEHFFNINSYIIVENNKVISFVFTDFMYLVFILRAINKEITFELSTETYNKLKALIENNLENEFKSIK